MVLEVDLVDALKQRGRLDNGVHDGQLNDRRVDVDLEHDVVVRRGQREDVIQGVVPAAARRRHRLVEPVVPRLQVAGDFAQRLLRRHLASLPHVHAAVHAHAHGLELVHDPRLRRAAVAVVPHARTGVEVEVARAVTGLVKELLVALHRPLVDNHVVLVDDVLVGLVLAHSGATQHTRQRLDVRHLALGQTRRTQCLVALALQTVVVLGEDALVERHGRSGLGALRRQRLAVRRQAVDGALREVLNVDVHQRLELTIEGRADVLFVVADVLGPLRLPRARLVPLEHVLALRRRHLTRLGVPEVSTRSALVHAQWWRARPRQISGRCMNNLLGLHRHQWRGLQQLHVVFELRRNVR
eukprot:PhM_4_TR3009/c1_g2_i4/m.37808